MLKRYQLIVGGCFRVIDGAVAALAWVASYWLRFYLPPFEVTKGFPSFATYASLAPLVAVLWMTVFAWMRVYESRRMLPLAHDVGVLLKAHGVAMLLFIVLTYLVDDYKYSRLVMAYFGVLAAGTLVFFRLTLRMVLRAFRKRGFNLRHALAVGEGRVIEMLIQRVEAYPELGVRLQGVVTHEDYDASAVANLPVVGHYGQIAQLIQERHIDEVLVAMPSSQSQELRRVLEALQDETVDIHLVPDIQEYVALGCHIEEFEGLPLVRLNDGSVYGWGALAKRVTDVTLSLAALICLAPVLGLIALAVKLSSRGPVLYVQERMGLDGRTFPMLKFRSMRVDAESRTGAVWAQAKDDRRTALGTFLRKTSLDELPQLWNVFWGDMSLVGPRPERPVFVHQFRKEIPHYMLRHKVKSGITGLAQVNGWRGNTSLRRRIECDLDYIRNWSYVLDLKIMTMTLWKGFINKNAY